MGGVIASCVGGCCAGCASSLCDSCNKAQGSATTRVPYLILMFVSVAVATILRYWGAPLLIHIYWQEVTLCTDKCMGFGAVYRISFTLFAFFLVHALALYGGRTKFHSAYWAWKLILMLLLIIISFVVPNGFFDVYAQVSRFAAGVFLLVQIVLLIDFAYSWNESWLSEERDWKIPVLVVSLALYVASLVLCIYGFKWFTDESHTTCHNNKFFLAFTIILTVIFSVTSVTEWCEHGALLPSAAVTLYCWYLVITGLSNDPGACNGMHADSTTQVVIGILIAAASITYSCWSVSSSTSLFQQDGEDDERRGLPLVPDDGTGAAASSSSSSSSSSATGPSDSQLDIEPDDARHEQAEMSEQVRKENQKFHFVMTIASMYFAMALTNWGSNEGSSAVTNYDMSTVNMYIKLVTQWLTALLYQWTLVAPYVLTGRDFS